MSDEPENTEAEEHGSASHPPPKVEPKREYGHEPPERLQEGHEPPEHRGHQTPSELDLGHPPSEGDVSVQPIGEMHTGAEESPRPTAPPPKRDDAARSVRAPEAREEGSPPAQDDENNG